MKFTDKFVIANGVRMHYLESGQGTPLIFIPGLFGTADMYKSAGSLLAKKYKVIIINLPGVGKSGKLSANWSFEDYYKSIYSFIRLFNFTKINIVGHSFGGMVAISLAVNNPDLIKNLVLVNSLGVSLEQPYKAWLMKTFRNVQQKKTSALMEFFPEFLKNLLIPHFRDMGRQIKIITETDFKVYLKKMDIPALILWGTKDNMLSLDYGYRLKNMLKNSKLIEVEGGSHNWIIPEPQRFYNYLRYYIE